MRKIYLNIDNKQYNSPDFYIEFNVKSDDRDEQPISDVSIYNLDPATVNNLKTNKNLTLAAGYGDDTGNILRGQIDQVESVWDGPTRITTMKVVKNKYEWREGKLDTTYNKGVNAEYIIRDLAEHMGLSLGCFNIKNNITYRLGKTITGKMQDNIQKIVKETGSKMKIEDNVLFVYLNGDNIDHLGFELTPKTGLLTTPQLKKETINGLEYSTYTLETLLMHQYRVDMGVKIQCQELQGEYRIESINHNDEFNTVLTVVPKNQPRKPEQDTSDLDTVSSSGDGATPEGLEGFFQALYAMEGWWYSQAKRMSDGYADCSSLVERAAMKAGLSRQKSWAITTHAFASDADYTAIPLNQARKGDILWRSGHVGVYMGGNDTYEARKPGTQIGLVKNGQSHNGRWTKAYRFTKLM